MLEKIYEQYKEGLSKSDHKILGYLMSMKGRFRQLPPGTCQSGLGISTATISASDEDWF